ncbi:MAG TPA: hypothetical protein VJN89_11930 [Candidatus Acidoferrum sp.]|nr:hypothetical protein [Candidatus Acidoferrum sp.]
MRAPMPLIVRGGLSRTFGSLAGFTALGLLSLGIYLLADAFAHPVDADAVGIIVAAFAMAIAMLLLIFIFRSRRFLGAFRHKQPERSAHPRANAFAVLPFAARPERSRSDLPYQRIFVDRSRIQPRTPSTAQARGIAGK